MDENLIESRFELNTDQFKQALRDVMQEVKEADATNKKINKSTEAEAKQQAEGMFSTFKNGYAKIQAAFFQGFLVQMMIKKIQMIGTAVVDLAKKADQTKIALIGVSSVAKSFGEDGGIAVKYTKEIVAMSGGMVDLQQSAQGLKFLIASGFNLEEAMNLTKSMLDIGAFNNVVGDLGQAYLDATKGIKTGSVELTENIGLTERLSGVMKRAGISIENGIDVTNNAAQRTALYNSIIKQGTNFTGDAAKVQEEFTGKLAKSSLSMKDFGVNIGKMLQPIVSLGASLITNLVKPFNEAFGEQVRPADKLYELIDAMEELKKISKPTAEEQEKLKNVMNQISVLAPSSVTAYDNLGNAQINFAESTRVLLDMKKLELMSTNKQLEADKKLAEQTLKKIDSQKKNFDTIAMGMSGIETTSAQFAKFQSDLAKSKGKSIQDLTLEEMLAYAKQTKAKFTNEIGIVVDLGTQLNTALAIKNQNTRKLNEDAKMLNLEIATINSVTAANKEIIGMDPTAYFNKLKAGMKTVGSKTTDGAPPEKDKYDSVEASKDFYRQQLHDFEEAQKDYDKAKKDFEGELIDKYALEIAQKQYEASKKIFNLADSTRVEISKSENAKKTDEIKSVFESSKKKTEAMAEVSESEILAKKKAFEDGQKAEEELKKLNEKANEEIIKGQDDLNNLILDAIESNNEKQTELEKNLAFEKIALKRKIAEEEIRLNEEILNAKTKEEKEALQKSFESKMNDFTLKASQESLDKQKVIEAQIEQDKKNTDLDNLRTEEMKKVREQINQIRNGETDDFNINLDEYKNLTDKQREVLQKEVDNVQEFARQKKAWNDFKTNMEESAKDTTESIYEAVVKGESMHWSDMRELLKENVKAQMISQGSELAGDAIFESVKGLISLAKHDYPTATQHFTAASGAAAGAVALGVAASAIKTSGSSSSSTSSTTSTTDTTNDTDTTTTTEDTKEIHIHNTSLKNIALSLIPEIESLAKDGYTKIVLEDN